MYATQTPTNQFEHRASSNAVPIQNTSLCFAVSVVEHSKNKTPRIIGNLQCTVRSCRTTRSLLSVLFHTLIRIGFSVQNPEWEGDSLVVEDALHCGLFVRVRCSAQRYCNVKNHTLLVQITRPLCAYGNLLPISFAGN